LPWTCQLCNAPARRFYCLDSTTEQVETCSSHVWVENALRASLMAEHLHEQSGNERLECGLQNVKKPVRVNGPNVIHVPFLRTEKPTDCRKHMEEIQLLQQEFNSRFQNICKYKVTINLFL
jgi:hypothetical protein